jgi:alanyl-tRNA synthetase
MVEVPGASLELCGGQHVRSTGEIGLFKILHEGSAAGGVRRIEAVTGEGAYEWVLGLERASNEAAKMLKCRPGELAEAIARLQETQRELRRKVERARSQGGAPPAAQSVWIGEVELVVEALTEASADEARAAADRLADGHPERVAVVGTVSEGKAGFWCKVGPKALGAGAHAGQLVRALAERVGGGGGGRPDFAAAGGRQVDRFDGALAATADVLREQLSGK